MCQQAVAVLLEHNVVPDDVEVDTAFVDRLTHEDEIINDGDTLRTKVPTQFGDVPAHCIELISYKRSEDVDDDFGTNNDMDTYIRAPICHLNNPRHPRHSMHKGL